MPDFPILDAPRTEADAELGRLVIADLGAIEPHIAEVDDWCTMPVRIVHDQAGGLHMELGPYSLDVTDIAKLREAIRQYDIAERGGSALRVIS